MATFRPGKPRSLRTLTAPKNQATAPYLIPWDSTETSGSWGAATTATTLQVAIAGLYLVTFGLGHTAGTGAQSSAAELRVGGSRVAWNQSASSAGLIGTGAAFMDELEVGNTIELYATNLALTGGKQLDHLTTRLAVTRIGPVRWT